MILKHIHANTYTNTKSFLSTECYVPFVHILNVLATSQLWKKKLRHLVIWPAVVYTFSVNRNVQLTKQRIADSSISPNSPYKGHLFIFIIFFVFFLTTFCFWYLHFMILFISRKIFFCTQGIIDFISAGKLNVEKCYISWKVKLSNPFFVYFILFYSIVILFLILYFFSIFSFYYLTFLFSNWFSTQLFICRF